MRSQTFQRLRLNVLSFGIVKSSVSIHEMSLPQKKKNKFAIERFYWIQFIIPVSSKFLLALTSYHWLLVPGRSTEERVKNQWEIQRYQVKSEKLQENVRV